MLADQETPVSAYHKLRAMLGSEREEPHTFLLESVVGGERVARHSFVGTSPFAVLTSRGNEVTVEEGERTQTMRSEDPLGELQSRMSDYPAAPVDEI